VLVLSHDWAETGRKELEAQRDPSVVFRMPLCRFAALWLRKPKHVWLAEVNAERKRRGLKEIPAHLA
jgi:hypothetical protein